MEGRKKLPIKRGNQPTTADYKRYLTLRQLQAHDTSDQLLAEIFQDKIFNKAQSQTGELDSD